MSRKYPKCPRCHVEQAKGIAVGSFSCSGCGERLSIAYEWGERRFWTAMVLTAVIMITCRINPGVGLVLWLPVSCVVAIALCVISAAIRPPDLECHLPPGSLGNLNKP
jgi:hypothetical protein